MALAKNDDIKAPVSSGDVIKYLVQSEPLNLVTEISSYVDLCSSWRGQHYIMRESSNALIEGEKRMMTSVDQLLDDVQGLYATVEQLLKVADNVVSTRSRDLQGATSLLYSNPPLTTPQVASLGADSLAQIKNKVEQIVVAQDSVRNRLEIDRDNIKAAFCAISDRGESLNLFLDLLLERMRNLPPLPLGVYTPYVEFESLCNRYQRRSQYLLATIERVARNSKTIHDLALSLERDRSCKNVSTTLGARAVTLAEELLVWGPTNATTLSQFGLLPWLTQIMIFGWCCIDRISSITQPRLLGVVSLLVLFIVFNVTLRTRFHAGGLSHTVITSQATPSKSIRDLLLEGRTSVSDELIRNLVPRRV